MRDEHAHTREAVLAEAPPQALVEAADAVVGVGGGFAVGDAVEEMAVRGALLPHGRHGGGGGLEVPEVLLAQAGFLVNFDGGEGEGGGGGGGGRGGGEGGEDARGGFARAAVGGREEVEGVGGAEQRAEFVACFFGLEGGGTGVSEGSAEGSGLCGVRLGCGGDCRLGICFERVTCGGRLTVGEFER